MLGAGLLIGQVTTLINTAWRFGLGKLDPAVEDLVRKAVQEAIQECGSITTTTSTSTPGCVVLGKGHISNYLLFSITGSILVLVVGGFGCCWWFCRDRQPKQLALESSVSAGSPLSIRTLAQNQLAEVRLRRHGVNQPLRVGGV